MELMEDRDHVSTVRRAMRGHERRLRGIFARMLHVNNATTIYGRGEL